MTEDEVAHEVPLWFARKTTKETPEAFAHRLAYETWSAADRGAREASKAVTYAQQNLEGALETLALASAALEATKAVKTR